MFPTPQHHSLFGKPQKRRHKAKAAVCLAALLGCFCQTGCQQTRSHEISQGLRLLPRQATAESLPDYSELVLNYEPTDFCSLVTRLRPATIGSGLSDRLLQVSAQESSEPEAKALSGQWSNARIQIIYPHPDGSKDKGLARLIVSRESSLSSEQQSAPARLKGSFSKLVLKVTGTSEELAELVNPPAPSRPVDEEIWQLDLAKEELDILLSELSHRGFFEKQERPRGEAIVAIKVDEGALTKRWTSEPRLEGLMLQIYNEGELTAFNTRANRITQISQTQTKKMPLDG